jgi:prophage antirepressor-like protein
MTEHRITPFLYDGDITVRLIEEDGREKWVTVDVCRALGLRSAADAVRGLDDDERGMATIHTLGGPQQMIVVYESGLYALILKSQKPEAQRFRKWLTSEVLPALRRHGAYTMTGFNPTRKPYPEWSNEDIRVALAEVNTAIKAMGRPAGAWTWKHVGLPVPPAHLLPAWWQADLAIERFNPPA